MTKPRDANDILREEGAAALRRRLDARKPYVKQRIDGRRPGRETLKTPKTPKQIRLVRGERARVTDEALAILRNNGDLFERGGELVRIAGGVVEPVVTDWLLDLLDRDTTFVGARRQGDSLKDEPRDAPEWLGKRIMAKKGERGFRALRALISAPTMRGDGTLVDVPGYDEATGLLLLNGTWPCVPVEPTVEQMQAAAAALWWPFAAFPFVDETARSVMLAAILTAVIRQTLPLAPAISFDAPTAATGKTLLANTLQAICGMDRDAIPECRDQEEVRKRLLAALRSGQSTILFDNIRGQFGSGALEAMLTTSAYTDRQLGASRMLTLPTTALVLISGNNFRPAGDLWRRLLTCRIDARVEAPERRSFDIEPFSYCRNERQRMVTAALTLLRGFVAADSPRTTSDRLASYQAWDDRVRQAVIWIGAQGLMPKDASVSDPVNIIERAKRDEPERQKLAALLFAAHATMSDGRWRVADLIKESDRAIGSPIGCPESVMALRGAIEDVASDRGKINSRILGRWIEKQVERRCDGLWFARVGVRWGSVLWQIQGQPVGDLGDLGVCSPDGEISQEAA